ncbi:hypothetical protein [Sedimenticola hydrogenitrophicus]|uniref:hypothetical protein n=1 Tax=Sedimenticola hydrogenitrophicus TaxID=2967975 RepID=UPI0023B00520|nr:hypothetical protein [Sedimenticola hydrogenitrophicus]
MKIMENKRLVLGASGALLGVLLLGGYFYTASYGVEQFEDYLYDNRLQDAIRYRDISYSPLSDTISLRDVDLDLVLFESGGSRKAPTSLNPLAMLGAVGNPAQKKVSGKLDSLSLKGVSGDDRLELRFSGFEIITNPTPDDRQQNLLYEFGAAPLAVFRQLGIDRTRLAGTVSYHYDQSEDVLTVALEFDAEQIAGSTIELELGRARRLVEVKIEELVSGAMTNPGRLIEEFGRVEFRALEARVTDHGFIQNLAYLDALEKFNYAKALNEGWEIDALRVAEQESAAAMQASMADVLDKSGIEALQQFQLAGGSLRLSSEAKRPVRFADLIRDGRPHRDISVKLR